MSNGSQPIKSPPAGEHKGGVIEPLSMGLVYYCLTSLVVIIPVVFAADFVPLCRDHPRSKRAVDLASALAAWDGVWYTQIASTGYRYDPDQPCAVVFFPVYPLLAGALAQGTGMRTEWALLVISHGALVAVFAFLNVYVRKRTPGANDDLRGWTLLAFGLFPTTFFFRMAYTESLFLMLLLIALLGMEWRWPSFWIALVIGLATGTRSVGVALVPVFALYVWQRMRSGQDGQASGRRGVGCRHWLAWSARVGMLLPVCCWGLLAYVLFLGLAFGEPWAFVKSQAHWNERVVTLGDRVVGLFSLEPFRAVYDAASACYWGRVAPRENALFNLKAANPVYFSATVCLVGLGVWKRWLNLREVVLAGGLLAVAYWFQASRACMTSQARYASAVFPVYLVLGHLLQRAPAPLSAGLLAISGLLLGIYAMMFVSWYWFI